MIDSWQVWSGVLQVGPSGVPLNSSYRTRDSLQYRGDLGNALGETSRWLDSGLSAPFLCARAGSGVPLRDGTGPALRAARWDTVGIHDLPLKAPVNI